MGSIAVDKGIAKLGAAADFYAQLDTEAIAEHILASARGDIHEVVERIMEREHPQLWHDLPPRLRAAIHARVEDLRAGAAAPARPVQRPGALPQAPAGGGGRLRRHHRDEIVTMGNMADDLMHGPNSDRTRRMIEVVLGARGRSRRRPHQDTPTSTTCTGSGSSGSCASRCAMPPGIRCSRPSRRWSRR